MPKLFAKMKRPFAVTLVFVTCFLSAFLPLGFGDGAPKSTRGDLKTSYAEIRVIDAESGLGVPLVELVTVNNLRFVTDNAGRIAFDEPGLMDREVFFEVRTHGYEMKKDGFGFSGVRVTPKAAQVVTVKITRRNLAERMGRLTGEGRYRDTLLLGHKPPLAEAANPGLVAGQDSVQAVQYKGKIHWFWGDTARMSYPLGLFRTSGAKTPIPTAKFDLTAGMAFDYFVDKTGFARAMMPLPERPKGVIWIDGVCTVPDEKGIEKLVAHYSRRKGLAEELEHGIAVFDDEREVFLPMKELALEEKWRFPHGHPELFEEDGKKWLLFGQAGLNVRVPAALKDVLDPKKYEAFTCATAMEKNRPTAIRTGRDGKPIWQWQSSLPPMGSDAEAGLVKASKLKPEKTRFLPANSVDPKERVRLHSGTVRWNEHRKRWVMVAGQIGGKSSWLGEVWYAEAAHPTGPFETAVKLVTHEKQSFYNVCHHSFLDQGAGRFIHFEGTYTNEFSGNPDKTPRYNYNQILYRLDLKAVALDGK
jgi:hypothetical protein